MERRTLLKYAALTPLAAIPNFLVAQEKENNTATQNKNSDTMKIQRLAWAGIKIEVGKTTLFVDATCDPEEGEVKLTAETEFKHGLITHHHGDHYDPTALKTVFDKNSLLVCHQDVLPWINATELRTQTVKMYEPFIFSRRTDDFVATAVPAVDGFGHPQVSWIIEGGGKKIIHCGDTLWNGNYWDLGRIYGPFDMAFMPINGARQNLGRYTDEGIPCVMTPEQAVVASKLLKAKEICPIHYGGVTATYFEVPDPEGTFIKIAKEKSIKTQVMKQGEFVKW
jgi:L-ascorbate metabolism protein UlaG (beta-lactamase superfamily)